MWRTNWLLRELLLHRLLLHPLPRLRRHVRHRPQSATGPSRQIAEAPPLARVANRHEENCGQSRKPQGFHAGLKATTSSQACTTETVSSEKATQRQTGSRGSATSVCSLHTASWTGATGGRGCRVGRASPQAGSPSRVRRFGSPQFQRPPDDHFDGLGLVDLPLDLRDHTYLPGLDR